MKNDHLAADLAFDFCKKAMLERIAKAPRNVGSNTLLTAFDIDETEYKRITDSLRDLVIDLKNSPTYSDTYYILLESSSSLTEFVIKTILNNELQIKLKEENDPFLRLIKLISK